MCLQFLIASVASFSVAVLQFSIWMATAPRKWKKNSIFFIEREKYVPNVCRKRKNKIIGYIYALKLLLLSSLIFYFSRNYSSSMDFHSFHMDEKYIAHNIHTYLSLVSVHHIFKRKWDQIRDVENEMHKYKILCNSNIFPQPKKSAILKYFYYGIWKFPKDYSVPSCS